MLVFIDETGDADFRLQGLAPAFVAAMVILENHGAIAYADAVIRHAQPKIKAYPEFALSKCRTDLPSEKQFSRRMSFPSQEQKGPQHEVLQVQERTDHRHPKGRWEYAGEYSLPEAWHQRADLLPPEIQIWRHGVSGAKRLKAMGDENRHLKALVTGPIYSHIYTNIMENAEPAQTNDPPPEAHIRRNPSSQN